MTAIDPNALVQSMLEGLILAALAIKAQRFDAAADTCAQVAATARLLHDWNGLSVEERRARIELMRSELDVLIFKFDEPSGPVQ